MENKLRKILTDLHGCEGYSGFSGVCVPVERALKKLLKVIDA